MVIRFAGISRTLLSGAFRKHPRNTRRPLLQRLFPAFPGGWPGFALLLLRAAVALAVLVQGRFYLGDGANGAQVTWLLGSLALAAGVLLLIGLLTPIAGTVVGIGGIGIGFSLLPSCTPNLFNSMLPVVFGAIMLLAIIFLGPGAFSVDARMFGRREIIIPPMSPSRK